jgi:hypothetical protein
LMIATRSFARTVSEAPSPRHTILVVAQRGPANLFIARTCVHASVSYHGCSDGFGGLCVL